MGGRGGGGVKRLLKALWATLHIFHVESGPQGAPKLERRWERRGHGEAAHQALGPELQGSCLGRRGFGGLWVPCLEMLSEVVSGDVREGALHSGLWWDRVKWEPEAGGQQ